MPSAQQWRQDAAAVHAAEWERLAGEQRSVNPWDELAATRQGAEANTWRGDPAEQAEMLRRVRRAVAPLGRALDLGCGIGRLALPTANTLAGTSIIGFDASAAMLHWAREADPHGTVEWVHGDEFSLSDVGPLNGAWSVLVFQHLSWPTQRSYLATLASLLKPGARFVLQWVTTGESAPLNHPVPAQRMARWVRAVGLRIEAMNQGWPYPEWAWLEAVKP